MKFTLSAAALLLGASSAVASPAIRRQAATLDTKVRVILRNSADSEIINFSFVETNVATGVRGPAFTTLEVDVGSDADPTLRCAARDAAGAFILATRGANLDTTFSDATNGEWTFEGGPVAIADVICDVTFEADNQNA